MLKWARLLYFCMYLYNVVTDIFIFPCGYLNLQSYECVRWMISENWKTASRSSLAMSVGQSQYWVKIIPGSEFQKYIFYILFSILAIYGYFSKIRSKIRQSSIYIYIGGTMRRWNNRPAIWWSSVSFARLIIIWWDSGLLTWSWGI